MGCSGMVKIVLCGKEWYYQSFWGDDECYRLYDADGEFLREFKTADDMTSYVVEESSRGQKSGRENMQRAFMMNIEKLKGNMSDAKFASLCGIKYETCYQYFTGRRFPSVQALAQIADACGVTIDWLVGRGENNG